MIILRMAEYIRTEPGQISPYAHPEPYSLRTSWQAKDPTEMNTYNSKESVLISFAHVSQSTYSTMHIATNQFCVVRENLTPNVL